MSKSIWITESHVNLSKDYLMGEDHSYESYFDSDNSLKSIFNNLQKEMGRCVGKVYVDTNGNQQIQVGWIFQRKDFYEDTHDPFIHETWVTLHAEEPEKKVNIIPHYYIF